LLNAINSAGFLSDQTHAEVSHPELEGTGTAPAHSRLVPALDRLMLADYDPSIGTADPRK
jgi:hypothetical protein